LSLTAAFTGFRIGELLALRWRDVDFAGSAVRVRASYYAGHLTTPKSGKVRAVPLAPDVATALAQLGRRVDWIGDDGRELTSAWPRGCRKNRASAGPENSSGMNGTRQAFHIPRRA
jgi:integrase